MKPNLRDEWGRLIGGSRERFMLRVRKTESCWVWTGRARCKQGYGAFSIGNKERLAHRVSYEHFNGWIPEGKLVLHRCDNTRCVNPEHLFLGTHSDNLRDAYSKGRGPKGYRRTSGTKRPIDSRGRFTRLG